MNRQTTIMLLILAAVAAIGYAVYRSTDVREVLTSNDGRQFVYGEPQHGLILGLCIVAGTAILGAILLLLDRRRDNETVVRKRTLE